MKKLLSLYLLLSLAAQPLFGMQAVPQSSSTGKTIAAVVGATGLIAAIITYLLLAKSDKQVCDEFHTKVVAALNRGDTNRIKEDALTIRPLFSSETHGEFSRNAGVYKCVHNHIYSDDNRYRVIGTYHDIYCEFGFLRGHSLRAYPEINPHYKEPKSISTSAS